ncbi:MAG: hypothetical protein PHW76_03185 [Alphaproteobacteria bacterium]|nr:hypothetical protein [Alphaproteobacteria bacterium]
MDYESLRLIRDSLFRMFIVGFIIAIILWIGTEFFWQASTELSARMFRVDPAVFAAGMLWYFTAIKYFLLFLVLTPALAIHWTLKKECDRCRRPQSEKRA